MEFSYGEVEAATKGFALESLVGKGSHGHVYKGVLRNGRQVAVKKPSTWLHHEDEISKVENEVEILASIQSRSIVNLVGTTTTSGRQRLLVMELMPNGSLHDQIHETIRPPTWPSRLRYSLQIAQALQTLHAAVPPVVHRDVKSSNVLMDSRGDAKLADFSLAVRDIGTPTGHVPAGTIGYLDPCYTGPDNLSTRNDIFSYGVLMLELISGRRVMDAACDTMSIVNWAAPLLNDSLVGELCDPRMPLSRELEKAIGKMISVAAKCVYLEEERRPSADEIVAELQSLIEHLQRRPIWNQVRSSVCGRIDACVKVWRKRRKHRVTATIILCKNHLPLKDDGDGDGGDGGAGHGNGRKSC